MFLDIFALIVMGVLLALVIWLVVLRLAMLAIVPSLVAIQVSSSC